MKDKGRFTEITAKRDRCQDSLVCPAVFEDFYSGSLVIVGSKVEEEAIAARTGHRESAVEIDRGLLIRAICGPLSRLLMRVGL